MAKRKHLIEDYFKYHDKYATQYGYDKTLIFMQVGKFYEAYSLYNGEDNKTGSELNDSNISSSMKKGPDLLTISRITNIMRSQKNKSISEINIDNPYFLGFPTVSLFKFVEMLIDKYTIVIVDQMETDEITRKKEGENREVTSIYSRGTYIENIDSNDTKYIICAYITEEKQKAGNILLCCGLSAVDLSTSKVLIHEAYSSLLDNNFALDETSRFINSLGPKEILIYYESHANKGQLPKMTPDEIIGYLEIDRSICRSYTSIDGKVTKTNYQNEMLKKIYPNSKTLISPIEYLDLNDKVYASISLCMLFDFVADKNKNLLQNLSRPINHIDNSHLVLGNDAITQLNLIDVDAQSQDNSIKYKSLFHVINQTSTAQGERFLKSLLISPITSETELKKIYDMTEEMIKYDFWKNVEKYLAAIHDVERMERKVGLNTIRPNEFVSLINSYENICDLADILSKKTKLTLLRDLPPEKKIVQKIKLMITGIKNTFDVTELTKYGNLEFKTLIFKEKIHEDLDKLNDNVDQGHTLMEKLRTTLISLLDVKSKVSNKNSIVIQNNSREGYYLKLTNSRAKNLSQKISGLKSIELDGHKSIDPKILIFKEIGKSTKIYFPSLDHKADGITDYYDQIESLNKKYYLEYINNLFKTYGPELKICSNFVTKIDYLKSCAKMVRLYNYVRPIIDKKEYGYVVADKLRHPIVERIIDYEYIPHNISIGTDALKGMLIYGLNSSGKSILMKSIGMAIIMAQAGLFVPANKFTFSPYNSLYTRITGNDNIFKGLSSFALEMVELNSILKRADTKTLVIGDEVCRGTEHISGNAIVATSIIKLSELRATFIFATHLHDISSLEEITSLKNVKSFHLKVDYDVKTDKLIYNRVLSDGPGDSVYGITVARHIIHDIDFIDTAMKIKNKLLKKYDAVITGKTSKYNADIYVHECHICGKQDELNHVSPLETHHINFQKDYKNGFASKKPHIMKNQQANLIVLCNECHDKIHKGKMMVNGYVMTSKGKSIIINDAAA